MQLNCQLRENKQLPSCMRQKKSVHTFSDKQRAQSATFEEGIIDLFRCFSRPTSERIAAFKNTAGTYENKITLIEVT